jgi:glucose-1-phosphate thymidylyltransferase
MKAVIPAAGRGTRLYPHIHTKPKPMVRVAGKPILGHILDNFVESRVSEVVVVVQVMKEKVIEFVRSEYGSVLDVTFVEQPSMDGLGHSIYQAQSVVGDSPVCIALGDMLFDSGYDRFLAAHEQFDGVERPFELGRPEPVTQQCQYHRRPEDDDRCHDGRRPLSPRRDEEPIAEPRGREVDHQRRDADNPHQ